ncbi:class I SAM-dependent methyltransferase [Sulfurihydrogenibium azorense]|uniref:class I SAM-dependent methyltransferase n=1 Tax=Sulfurihydrogenibium azorense TaxID=309806 RepID=UPI00240A7CB7|nr:SAM-dependent methyltransferase [Sulfurihydrogenibium azorense]MDM7274404.1 SAM-dependent methyltransferase [Sulfurihydrogenibium azorense]
MKLSGKKELIDIVFNDIKKRGGISFKDFMDYALYYPSLGYYTCDKEKIGGYGDFFTSSELDPVFGQLLAKQFNEIYLNYFKGKKIKLVELGSGKGVLALDILNEIKTNYPEFYENLEFISVEKSPFHIQHQQKVLNGFNVKWLESVEDLEDIEGIVYSNELFDALPVHLIKKKNGKIYEIYLNEKDGEIVEELREASEDVLTYIKELKIDIPEGMTTEVNLLAKDLIQTIGQKLKKGFVFTVDYGYPSKELYKPYRMKGTLLCYYKHTYNENFYENIGFQDITSHVNFSALVYYGKKAGLEFTGFTDQAHFLINLGLGDIMIQLQEKGDSKSFERINRLKTLILPKGMGEKFKILIQHKNIKNPTLSGLKIIPPQNDRYKIEEI